MGYYTSYSLDLIGDADKVKAFEIDLLNKSRDDQNKIDSSVSELIECGGTYAKLYDICTWISDIAPNHPDVLVILDGDGESSDDLWQVRWKGTECEEHHAEIPPFTNPNLIIHNI